uniref:NAD-dependent epimerase/dehydratase n=1 Tax=Caulobacter sp. (strain K31) TaxID=366602 RepID=B0T594_CAUSK
MTDRPSTERVLVTGAAGFIGYHLAKRLADDGHHVVCADNMIRGEDDEAYRALCERPNVTRVDIDLTDQAAVRGLPDDIDRVFHLAAMNGTQNFYERPFEVMRCCTLPTIFLLEKYGPLGLKRFVYTGTSEAYASTVTQFNWPVPTGEDVPLSIDDPSNVRWSYGASKMHGEVATQCAAKFFDLRFTVIRYHNVYGPRMGDKHVVPDFLIRARDGVLSLYGHEDTRAFLYIDDAVEATLRVAQMDACEGETINIGAEQEMTIRDLGEAMKRIAGLEGEITLHPSPKGSVKRRAPKVEKLKHLTNFHETWSLEDGLRETAKYYLCGQVGDANK